MELKTRSAVARALSLLAVRHGPKCKQDWQFIGTICYRLFFYLGRGQFVANEAS